MYPMKATKKLMFQLATGATAGETQTATVDTLGYDVAHFIHTFSSVATNKQPTVCKIEEGDTTSSFATWSAGMVGGTAANTSGFFTIPAGDTNGVNLYQLDVDCRARKRYLKFTVSPATTVQEQLLVILARAEQSPITTTAEGIHLHVHG